MRFANLKWHKPALAILVMLGGCFPRPNDRIKLEFPNYDPDALYIYSYDSRWTGTTKEFPINVRGVSLIIPEGRMDSLQMMKLGRSDASQFVNNFSGIYSQCYLISGATAEAITQRPTIFFIARYKGREPFAYVVNFDLDANLLTRRVKVQKDAGKYVFSNRTCYKRSLTQRELKFFLAPPVGDSKLVPFSDMLGLASSKK